MWKYYLVMLLFGTDLFAQNQQDHFNKQLEEVMKAREEMLRALMDDSMSGGLEKRMEEIMKTFGSQGDFGFGQAEAPIVGEYDWLETDTHKILKIKIKQIKDKPLDIKIQNNEIKIKGDVESTEIQGENKLVKKINFERIFEIPDDVDKTAPEFENSKDGYLLIKLKKINGKNAKPKEFPPKNTTPNQDERVPVVPDSKGLSI